MLFLQWKVYSEDQDEPPVVQQYVQIQQDRNGLHVRQIVRNIDKGTYTIQNPLNVEYQVENAKMVHSSLVVEKEQENVEFQYNMPFKESSSSTLLLDWALQLDGVETDYFRVEITVGAGVNGSWAAATKPVGKAKKEYVDYYVFDHSGPVFPLYYQHGEMSHFSLDNGIVVYFEPDKKLDKNQISALFSNFPEINERVLMFTSKHKELIWSDLVVLKDTYSIDQLEEKLSALYLDAVVPFGDENEKWQQHIIMNILQGKQEGSKKVAAMVDSLKSEIGEKELQSFAHEMVYQGKPLTTTILDEKLSAVAGKKTEFFSLNKDENTPLVPLYFYDSRKIMVNGNEVQESFVYLKNDQLIPFIPIAKALGYYYTVEPNNHLLVMHNEDSLRLYPDKKVFILNGRDYATSSNPITSIHDQLYIYTYWLEDLFDLNITNEESVINISTD